MVGSERDVTAVALFMVIADETDEAARARWQSYKDGVDEEAVAWLGQQGAADTKSKGDTNIRQMADPTSAVNINMGTLVGSYEAVASMLDEIAEVPATSGVMLTFDDFVQGIENFGQKIQPLMKSRKHVTEMLERIE
jgi:pyrimidine oxygenase